MCAQCGTTRGPAVFPRRDEHCYYMVLILSYSYVIRADVRDSQYFVEYLVRNFIITSCKGRFKLTMFFVICRRC